MWHDHRVPALCLACIHVTMQVHMLFIVAVTLGIEVPSDKNHVFEINLGGESVGFARHTPENCLVICVCMGYCWLVLLLVLHLGGLRRQRDTPPSAS